MLDNFADESHAQEWLIEFSGKTDEYVHCFNTVRDKLFGEFDSNTQVNAIIGSIQKVVSKELKEKPWHVEGEQNGEWVLMDYVSIVVHVFQKHIRDYYNIEALWGDAKTTSIASNY